MAEYAGLIVLAALILGALVAIGIPSKVETGVSSAICRIFQESNCVKPQAAGKTPGAQSPGAQSPGGQPTDGQSNGGPNNGNPNGKQPSLADLQKNADDAQKAADSTSSKYGNIKQEIIDLLKDFIGITDIEDCISKGSISSCLWAAFDVASWVFAALKIAKFAKAVKDAIKLWKEFNEGRKIIDRAKDAAKRAKELLRRKHVACGLPAAFTYPSAPPGRARYAYLAISDTVHFRLVADGDDFNQSMNKALEWLEQRGFKAEKPTIGKFGDTKGKPIGYQTADGKTGFRVEFDERSGAHINVWSGKEKGPHFKFNASRSTVKKIQGRYGCR